MNDQYVEEILKAREYLREVLKIGASSETKRSQCFETDILCMSTMTMNEEGQFVDIIIPKEEVKQNLNYVLEEDEAVGSHANTYEQSRESVSFQHATKVESRKCLVYDDSQEWDEAREEIKHSDVMLGENEKKAIEDFLSLVADLGHQEYLMIESSNKTIESCGFKADRLNVFGGIVEENPSYGHVLSEVETH